MDKFILETLEGERDFVEAAELLVNSLRLKNKALLAIAEMALPNLVEAGLIAASGGTQIKITPLGRENLEKEGRLSAEEKSAMH
jgi:hypothetical protein